MIKKLIVIIAALGLVAALAGCGGGATTEAPTTGGDTPPASTDGGGGDAVVNLQNTTFEKATVEIKAGSTVKWTNKDTVDHSIWLGDPDGQNEQLSDGDFSTDESFEHKFDKAGTYDIFCNTGAHHLLGMKMQVVVK